MEHLVESHMGGYYISSLEPSVIQKYCDQCGDRDNILLSWEPNLKLQTLSKYFSRTIIDEFDSLSNEELVDYLLYRYDINKDIIDCLFENKYITLQDKNILLKQVNLVQKKQLQLLNILDNSNIIKK